MQYLVHVASLSELGLHDGIPKTSILGSLMIGGSGSEDGGAIPKRLVCSLPSFRAHPFLEKYVVIVEILHST